MLGRHVIRSAQRKSGFGEPHAIRLGDAEIHEFGAAERVDVNVFRLDVAVDNLLQVNVADGAAHLQRNLHAPREVAGALVLDGVPQALAFEKFHHHEGAALLLAEIIHRDDVFVRDAGGEAGFLQESRLGFGVAGGRIGQNFERHAPSENAILGAVYARHAAAQEFLDFVFADARRVFHQRVTGATHFSVDKKSLLKTAGPPPVSTKNS